MRHIIVLFVTLLSTNSATAQQQTTGNDSINHIIQLQEIVVKGNNLVLEDDHIICIPTELQRKHTHSGFDLLYRMMIPNVSVDYQKGEVVTPAGQATLYINGRKATYREIESLRPKEVAKRRSPNAMVIWKKQPFGFAKKALLPQRKKPTESPQKALLLHISTWAEKSVCWLNLTAKPISLQRATNLPHLPKMLQCKLQPQNLCM